jgi:hypothetical protein
VGSPRVEVVMIVTSQPALCDANRETREKAAEGSCVAPAECESGPAMR